MTNQLTSRIGWIDTAKGIGLLCVIFGHLHIPYVDTWVYFFHMPLFFFLSGVVFSGRKYDFTTFLKKKVKSLVVPYFTLGGGIFLFFCIVYALEGRPGTDYLEMLKSFLVQEHYWTVWFLACLFLMEVLYYGIHRCFGKKTLLATAVSGGICIFGLARYRLGWGSLPWNLDVALVAQFFFHAGFCFKGIIPKLERFDRCKPLTKLAAAGGLMACNFALGLAGVVLIARMIAWPWLSWLGRNTMVIFGWHSRIVIVACQYLYAALGIFQSGALLSQLGYAAVTGAIIAIVLVPATHFIKRSRIHALFGL